MTDKQRVVISKRELDDYKSRGYSRVQGESLAEHVGAGWELLPKEDQDALVLVEIDAAAHQRRNSAAPAYVVHQRCEFVTTGAELLRLDALAESDGRRTLAAVAGSDEGPRWFLTEDIAPEPRLAVVAARLSITQAIAEHRRIADELESFLQGMECL
jgi:hypothetical protein